MPDVRFTTYIGYLRNSNHPAKLRSMPEELFTSAAVVPRDEWPTVLFVATSEVFSMMVGGEITMGQPACHVGESVAGTVGIAGAVRAGLTLRCATATAVRIASGMLGVPIRQAEGHGCDAIGEICNMVAGHFKAKIGLEAQCVLSVPLVIRGNDYQIERVKEGEHIAFTLKYEGEPLDVALDIHP